MHHTEEVHEHRFSIDKGREKVKKCIAEISYELLEDILQIPKPAHIRLVYCNDEAFRKNEILILIEDMGEYTEPAEEAPIVHPTATMRKNITITWD